MTPDGMALLLGRRYNRAKRPVGYVLPQKEEAPIGPTAARIAAEHGVSHNTVERAGKFAAAVETLRAIEPTIEAKVMAGEGPTRRATPRAS